MDALHEPSESRRQTVRSRSAPQFCHPQPAKPRPYAPRHVNTSGGDTPAGTSHPQPPARSRVAYEGRDRQAADPSRRVGGASIRSAWGGDDDDDFDDEPSAAWVAIGRGVALMFGTLLLVDLFAEGGLAAAGPWWLNVHPLPEVAAAGLLGISAAGMLMFAIRGSLPPGIRGIVLICLGLLMGLAVKDVTIYYGLLKRGDLAAGPPIAFSFHVLGCLGLVFLSVRSAMSPGGLSGTLLAFAGCAASAVALPIAHVACQGTIDARQSAAAAIVAGPRPYEAGLETRLQSRIDRAVALRQAGLVPSLILTASGDQERLTWMKDRLLAAGIPASEIAIEAEPRLDAALAKLAGRFSPIDGEEPLLLVVSDADHLPRLLLADRDAPLALEPVPSEPKLQPVRSVLIQEIGALWRCYLRR